MTTPATQLLKPAEVAHELRCSRATVYRLINDGKLATVGLGVRNATRIESTEVTRYIESIRRNKVA